MKKSMALFLAAVLSLSLFGCGKSKIQQQVEDNVDYVSDAVNHVKEYQQETKRKEEENKDKFANKQKKIKNAEFEMPDPYDEESLGATVKLKSFVVIEQTYNDNKLLVVTVDFTNETDGEASFSQFSGFIDTYQDGVRVGKGYSVFDKEMTTSIKGGKTIECVFTIELRDDKTDVEFDVNDEEVYTLKIK